MGGAAPAQTQQRPRLIVLFVDIDDIELIRRKQFFEGVTRFLDSAVRPGDFVAVLTWTKRVRVVLEPTTDRRRVDEVMKVFAEASRWSEQEIMRRVAEIQIEEAKRDAAFAASLGRQGPDPEAEAAFQEWVIAEQRCERIKRKAREIRNIVLSVARVDLQKVLIFASDDISLRPGRDCSTLHELDALANTANAYGITIHAFHPPGIRDRSVESPEIGGRMPGTGPPAQAAQYGRMFDESGGLLHLARRTGGHVGVGAGQSAQLLERAAEELETYYSLGYRLHPGDEDKPRKINVVTKNKAYRVRTRDSVVRLSEGSRLRDRVTTNLYLPEEGSSASLTFTPQIHGIRRDGRFMLADVVVSIPARSLTMIERRGSFSILVAAGRELGDASDVTELKQDFELAAPQDIKYSFTIRMRPDSRRLSVAVRDNVSGEVATKLVMLRRPTS